jgi:hypothetical protein
MLGVAVVRRDFRRTPLVTKMQRAASNIQEDEAHSSSVPGLRQSHALLSRDPGLRLFARAGAVDRSSDGRPL